MSSEEVRGTCAGQDPGPTVDNKGDVSYIAAFPGTFVSHTEEDARRNVEIFKHMGRKILIYRIEVIDAYIPPGGTAEKTYPEDMPKRLA
jgi:hypothetical protein